MRRKAAKEEDGGGGVQRKEGRRKEREREEGRDYLSSICGAIVPLSRLPASVSGCISMIKTWRNRAAGRSLDTQTMLSPVQASGASGNSHRGDPARQRHNKHKRQARM